jgi:uncharacterized protein (DUF302 family)
MEYTFRTTVPVPLDELRPRVEAALKDEGFGVLTEIDVAATLKAKLDLDRPPYLILGACNPTLASRAIEAEPSIGALLPCNVVLREGRQPNETVVEILDPMAALGLAQAPAIAPLAKEATERLRRVLAQVARP